MACQGQHQQHIEGFMNFLQQVTEHFVATHQIGNGQHTEPDGLEALGRAHEPATERNDDHQHVQSRMTGVGRQAHER